MKLSTIFDIAAVISEPLEPLWNLVKHESIADEVERHEMKRQAFALELQAGRVHDNMVFEFRALRRFLETAPVGVMLTGTVIDEEGRAVACKINAEPVAA